MSPLHPLGEAKRRQRSRASALLISYSRQRGAMNRSSLLSQASSGAPVACSTVTSLPEQAGDAALLFDADRPEEMAGAIARLWTDPALRAQLAARGRERVAHFTWDRTARVFRAHYRRIAGRPLTDEDRESLDG